MICQIFNNSPSTSILFFVQPDGLFSDRLAPDTLILDCKLSDRNHEAAEVSEIYDPPFSGKVSDQHKLNVMFPGFSDNTLDGEITPLSITIINASNTNVKNVDTSLFLL